jgi:predicted nucleic acid-binding protein
MIAVLDMNAVIGLAKGECLDRVRGLFREVVVPPAVRREVVEEGRGRAGAQELQAALGDWVREEAPVSHPAGVGLPALSPEDQEVLALALERGGVLVRDDVPLRREAARLEIPTLGTVQLALLMKQQGRLEAVRPVLDLMQARGYHIDLALYAEALVLAGEEEAG